MSQVIDHISNPLCSNSDCPNTENGVTNKKNSQQQQQQQTQQQKGNCVANLSNSVWKAELRVRYISNDFKELYEKDRITCHFYFNQVRDDYVLSNLSNIDHDIAIQLCCYAIRHAYREQATDKKHHIDMIEKEKKFNMFLPKSVIDTIKQKNLKKLIQTGYKKALTYTELEIILKFFEILRTIYIYDQEQFIVSIGSGWNIPVDLVIGPIVGISYLTHSQGKPNKVADFSNIERITTYVLSHQIRDTGQQSNSKLLNDITTTSSATVTGLGAATNSKGNNNSLTNSPSVNKKLDINNKKDNCSCSEIKTQLKISVTGNSEDLSITCNGIKVSY